MTEIWHVITCAGGKERWVGAELHRSTGLRWYVPLERRQNILRGRLIEYKTALIPGYLFLQGIEPTVWRDILETRHVHGCLKADDEPAPLYGYEIKRIETLEAEHNRAVEDARQRVPVKWKPGDVAMIKEGPFASMQSLLSAVRGSKAKIETKLGSAWVPLDALAPVA